jgi:hypothetical protein
MVDERLLNYVRQQLQAGYSIGAIRAALANYGYDQKSINGAVKAVSPKKTGVLILIAALAAVIIIIVLFFIIFGGKEEAAITVKTTPLMTSIEAGNALTFNIVLENPGSSISVNAVNQIIRNGKVVSEKKDSFDVQARLQKTVVMPVPSDAEPGSYSLQTSITYGTKTGKTSFDFDVIGKKTGVPEVPGVPEAQCPSSCDDSNKCTKDICDKSTGFECAYFELTPCCGNGICESGENNANCPEECKAAAAEVAAPKVGLNEVIANAKRYAEENAESGADYCRSLEKDHYKDSCFNAVADTSKKNIYCDPILSETSRDNCYTNFALDGDYTVCEKISNKYLKQSCISLSQVG